MMKAPSPPVSETKCGRAIAEPEGHIADRELDGVAGLLEREVAGEALTEEADVDVVAGDAQVRTSGNVEVLGFAADFELLRYTRRSRCSAPG